MRLIIGRMLVCLLVVGFLPSCANSRDIQNMAYVTALGVDYVNGEYKTYVQVLNFSNIARSENTSLGQKVPIWIGTGHGETLALSLADTNETSQFPLFWGHLKAVVLSENLMRRGGKETYATLNRHYEVRYNVLVFGTKEKMEDILTQKSIFNLSPLDTIMYTSVQNRSQSPYVIASYGNRLIANMNEPGNSLYIPSISINKHTWLEEKAGRGMFEMNGAYFFDKGRIVNWMSLEELKGLRWATEKINRTTLQVPLEDGHKGAILFAHPWMKVIPKVQSNGDVKFDLKVTAKGTIRDSENATIAEMEKQAEKAIVAEIRETYLMGLAKHCDPFKLEETLYRERPRLFHQLTKGGFFFLNEHSLGRVQVTVKIASTGKYKEIVK
ncbi:Ger(x)C family spore germination protein [Paenibacillus sp. JDR-2]|uniref:Ger(x)C family spore germination protein n=1 Tax=Paenibacillus sp. (strain JDR-2) TaxID=324057 RepID=UPI000166ADB7|nr:Ger(x)C family spore germination protein [Paenibacillus sp. JDR-2]ACT04678.1 germination protein, Ger(x)C family [Paenibacillus sp. JDR-2]